MFLILAAASFANLAAASPDAEVPDLETRIRNTGNSIPSAAIPAVPPPAPVALPAPPPAEPPVATPAPAPSAASAEAPTTDESEPAGAQGSVTNGEPPVTGFVRLGAGSPGTLLGELSVNRSEGSLPSLALDFSYTSADGYGTERSGAGFFDRVARASARVGKTIDRDADASGTNAAGSPGAAGSNAAPTANAGLAAPSAFALVDLLDATNGLQGKNPRYYGLTRRSVDWSFGARSLSLGSSAFSLSVIADGSVDSAFAEGPSGDSSDAGNAGAAGSAEDPATVIDDYAGYRLSPALALAFSRGAFTAGLSGTYAYETARDAGESNSGNGDLSLSYGIGGLRLLASGGVAGDGGSGTEGDGIVFPFSLGFVWNPARPDGTKRLPYVEEARASFGIVRERQSAIALAEREPLVETAGLSSYSADWAASGGFSLGMPLKGGASLSTSFGADWRKSLAGHGALALTDELTGSSLVAVRRVERDSLVASAGASLSASGFALDAGYSGEWLDRLDRLSLHSATVGARAFDRGADRAWEAGGRSTFALDRAEWPILSADGTVRPFRNFTVTLSMLDIIPLVVGEARTRNGLFAVRSGELSLSAKMDF